MPAPRQKAAKPTSKSPSYRARLCGRGILGLGEFSTTRDACDSSAFGASAFGVSTFRGRVIMCHGVPAASAEPESSGGSDWPYRSRGREPESASDTPLGSNSWLKSRSAPKSFAVDFLIADEDDFPS